MGINVYINDVGIFTNSSYEDHLSFVGKVLQQLQENGCKVNPLKCEWAVQEMEFLGHWITPQGICPYKKKIEAVLRLSPPQNMTQLRAFIGASTYYKSKGKFIWDKTHQDAFEQMKALMVLEALMAFPNHNLPFHIYTDASDYQMGAVIIQHGRVISYWSQKLSPAQKNYTTMEKELLSIVMCSKEF
eukprot:15354169-Ditylum_brightwellii.AAC.1